MKTDPPVWWQLPQKMRFLLVGGYNTVFGYLVFSGLFLCFGRWIHYLVIGVVSHLVAVINAFLVYRWLVFPKAERWLPSFLRFNLSQLLTLSLGVSGLFVLVEFAHLRPLVAQALVMAASVVLSYILHRYFSFREHS